MKKLVYEFFDKPIILEECRHYSIVIENPSSFQKFVYGIGRQIESGNEFLVYSEAGEVKSTLPEAVLITDLFNLSINDKKIINSLYKKLDLAYKQVDRDACNKIISQIDDFISKSSDLIDLNVDYNTDIQISGLLKLVDLHLVDDSNSLLELLVNYIKTLSELSGINLFFAINLNSVLSDDELILLYKELDLMKIDLINISFSHVNKFLPQETAIIIDNDLCEIDIH